jgi:hypothetical protein
MRLVVEVEDREPYPATMKAWVDPNHPVEAGTGSPYLTTTGFTGLPTPWVNGSGFAARNIV